MCSPSVFSEEYPPIREEDALAKWAADPANTAWMESKETIQSYRGAAAVSSLCVCFCAVTTCPQGALIFLKCSYDTTGFPETSFPVRLRKHSLAFACLLALSLHRILAVALLDRLRGV